MAQQEPHPWGRPDTPNPLQALVDSLQVQVDAKQAVIVQQQMNHWVYEGCWDTSVSPRRMDDSGFRTWCFQLSFPRQDINEIAKCFSLGYERCREHD